MAFCWCLWMTGTKLDEAGWSPANRAFPIGTFTHGEEFQGRASLHCISGSADGYPPSGFGPDPGQEGDARAGRVTEGRTVIR